MKRLCSICARGGSKGIPNKNLRKINGIPLIAVSILQAAESGLFNNIAVSSDSAEILECAARSGADILVKRPAELASDTAAKIPAIQHCFREAEAQIGARFDICVDLDSTSPLRSVGDLKSVMNILADADATNVITAAPARRSPYFNMVECNSNGVPQLAKPLPNTVVRRQDAPKCYDMNASIYAWKREALLEMSTLFGLGTRLYIMPEERSHDIDSPLDFEIVEFLLRRKSSINEAS